MSVDKQSILNEIILSKHF